MRWAMIVACVAVAAAGCSKPTEEELWQQAVERQMQKENDAAIEGYRELVEAYPAGRRTPEALYALGTLAQNEKHDPRGAVGYYRRLFREYPAHATASNAAFMIGFIFNNELHELDSAKIAYEEFLTKFPDSPMVSSAQFELATLGRSADELLAEKTAKTPKKKTRSR